MEPHKSEIEALREVMFTPVESFVTEKERQDKGDEWAEKTAHRRMFATAIKAVDEARGARTLWMVVLRFGSGTNTFFSAYGPYATQAQAEKGFQQLAATFEYTAHAIVPMRNAEGFAQLKAELDAKPPGKGDWAVVAEDAVLHRRGWDNKRSTRKKYEEAS